MCNNVLCILLCARSYNTGYIILNYLFLIMPDDYVRLYDILSYVLFDVAVFCLIRQFCLSANVNVAIK